MTSPRWPIDVGSSRWIATLGALTGLIALAIDMNLPAQPTIAASLGVSADTAQLNLSLFMVGFAIAQLLIGYLADAWGRRKVLLAGLVVFAASAFACAFAPNIETLIVCRVLQGIGGSAAPVIARAMIRDTQPATQAARLLSVMLAALAIAPMIAPTIGGLVMAAFGWRAIFATLALVGIVLLAIVHGNLGETLPPERRVVASPAGLVRNFRVFFATPGTRLPLAIGCTSFAGQFAYVADSPFVLMEGYGVSEQAFGLYFAATAVALMAGSLLGARMIRAGRSPGAMIVTGTTILVVAGALVTVGTRVPSLGIAGFLVPMVIFFFGTGISGPSATALALEPVPQIAGTASAAVGFLTMTAGAISGYLTTKIGGSDPRIFALVAAVMGAFAAACAYIAAAARHRRKAC